jgi:hypothetical protein
VKEVAMHFGNMKLKKKQLKLAPVKQTLMNVTSRHPMNPNVEIA